MTAGVVTGGASTSPPVVPAKGRTSATSARPDHTWIGLGTLEFFDDGGAWVAIEVAA